MSAADDHNSAVDDHDSGADDHHSGLHDDPGIDADDQVAGTVAGDGDQGDAGPSSSLRSEATVLRTVQSLGAVVGPTALITALLFYFGWAKAQAFSQYFGLDVSLFGLSTQDYLLQSIRSVFIPLGILLIGGLLLLWAHGLVIRQLELGLRGRLWRPLAGALALTGGASFVLGLVKNGDRYPSDVELIVTPLSLMLGVALLGYAVLVERRRRQPEHRAVPVSTGPMTLPSLNVMLVAMLMSIGLVWIVANYAEVKGREEAEFVHDQLEFQPGVVVYSAKRLHIGADGVKEEVLDGESAYGFRYQGLKLLFHTKARYFLLPDSWSLSNGVTVVVTENDSLRLEFVRPRG